MDRLLRDLERRFLATHDEQDRLAYERARLRLRPVDELTRLFGIPERGIETGFFLGGPSMQYIVRRDGSRTGYFVGGMHGNLILRKDGSRTDYFIGGPIGNIIVREDGSRTGYFLGGPAGQKILYEAPR